MATKKITDLTELSAQPASNDVVAIVDIDADVTKKITISNLQSGVQSFPFTGDAQISGSLLISGSMEIDSLGNNNVIIGSGSGKALSSGANNIIFGNSAATSLTTGNSNLIIGHRAGRSTALNIESGNTLIGIGAGEDGTYLSDYGDNTFIGYNAGKGSAAQFSVFVGSGVGQGTTTFSVGMGANGTLSCTAAASVAIGYNSQTNGSNNYNVSVGTSALQSNNGGSINTNNIAIGYQAGFTSYRLNGNIFIGHKTGYDIGTGDGNIIIGSGSLGRDMNDQLRIGNGNSFTLISGSLADGGLLIQGQVSASSYIGDGSGLSGISVDSTSIASGSTTASADPNDGIVINASGSTLFDVRGSLGSMFSVTDSFDGNLFEVNNISGISLLSVSSSGDVDIPKGGLTVSGSVSASKFLGDGSQLTGVSAFPFTGDAVITGSLIVSSSNSTASLTLEGSGSTVFSVIGSTGTLFEVDDSLEGIIFTANDSTGAPSFQVSSSGEVFLGKSPQSLYTTKQIASTISTATESIFSMTTSSLLTTLAFDYSCVSESNARTGTINSVFIPGTDLITFSETATSDIGDTSGVHLSVEITQSQAQFLSKTDSAGWRIKSIIRSI